MDTVRALHEGRAFADLSGWQKVLVRGGDARGWLNDLITADVGGLEQGRATPSLLLTPTGRIRATFTVALVGDGFVVVQDPEQPEAVDAILSPYTLSADVVLEDRSTSLALLAFPGSRAPDVDGAEGYAPSCLGAGADLVAPAEARDRLRAGAAALVEAGPNDVEHWRIERGEARFPVDLGPDSLPHEAPLEAAIAEAKGCFLGQEAVARVRNLGHPPFVVRALRARGSVRPGEPVLADGREAGRVTSAAPVADGETATIARVRWAARDASLTTPGGVELVVSGPPAA